MKTRNPEKTRHDIYSAIRDFVSASCCECESVETRTYESSYLDGSYRDRHIRKIYDVLEMASWERNDLTIYAQLDFNISSLDTLWFYKESEDGDHFDIVGSVNCYDYMNKSHFLMRVAVEVNRLVER